MRRILSLLVLLLAALVTGCATAPYMPLAEGGAKLEPTKPLYLMSVTVKNEFRDRWQPRVLNVVLEKDGGAVKSDPIVLRMDDAGTIASDSGNSTYLVRFSAESAPQILRGFNAIGSAFPFHGFFFLPLHASLANAEGGVHYLGAVKAVVRERKDGEFRAGPVMPILAQGATGASDGTFDVEITDVYDADVALFRKTFPVLKDVEVKKSVLPKWDRAKAQLYWEKN